MAKLDENVKAFIVMELATYRSPTEVAGRVGELFGIEITRHQAYDYDPTGAHGHKVAKKWKVLFGEAREAFKMEVMEISVTYRAYRLREISDMYLRAKRTGNLVLASSLLEQAAKEMGDSFTNRRELTGKDGKPAVSAVVVLPEKIKDGP